MSSTPSTSSNHSTPSSSASQTRGVTSSASCRLPKFASFKSAKERERSSFFVRKNGSKRSKMAVSSKEVKVTIAVMEDAKKIKRGDSLPLKVPESSTPEEILRKAVEKHAAFNKRFNARIEYSLVFKDGTEVKTTLELILPSHSRWADIKRFLVTATHKYVFASCHSSKSA